MEFFFKKWHALNYDTNGVFSLDNLKKKIMMDPPFNVIEIRYNNAERHKTI